MSKYVTAYTWPAGTDPFDLMHYPHASRTIVAVEAIRAPMATGLLNAAGVPLYRVNDSPLGFPVRP